MSLVDTKSRNHLSKDSNEIANVLSRICRRNPLRRLITPQVDPGHEFMGGVKELLSKYDVKIRRGNANIHLD